MEELRETALKKPVKVEKMDTINKEIDNADSNNIEKCEPETARDGIAWSATSIWSK